MALTGHYAYYGITGNIWQLQTVSPADRDDMA